MAKWSKVLPLIACCISPLSSFNHCWGMWENYLKDISDLGLCSFFFRYSGFLLHLELGRYKLAYNMAEKAMIIRISNYLWRPGLYWYCN